MLSLSQPTQFGITVKLQPQLTKLYCRCPYLGPAPPDKRAFFFKKAEERKIQFQFKNRKVIQFNIDLGDGADLSPPPRYIPPTPDEEKSRKIKLAMAVLITISLK